MKRVISLLLAAVLLLSVLPGTARANAESWQEAGLRAVQGQKKALGLSGSKCLLGEDSPLSPGDSVSDWLALDLALLGAEDDYEAYLKGLEQYVTARYAKTGKLDQYRATEWHRTILVVLALGGDPTAFGTAPDGTAINLVADGIYNYVNGDLGLQGINGYAYALMALNAGGFACPQDCLWNEERILDAMLAAQSSEGGFGLTPGSADVDLTAMALQALAPYADGIAKEPVERALAFLSRNQEPDGGFAYGGEASCESAAQVTAALCALDLEPERCGLAKPNGDPLSAMMSFRLADGTFSHDGKESTDAMATSQALFALAAKHRRNTGQAWALDFGSYSAPKSVRGGSTWLIPVLCAAGAAVLCAATLIGRKKRKHD